MRPLEFLRTTEFRWGLTGAGASALSLLIFAALMYHETVGYMTRHVDAELRASAYSIAQGPLADQIDDVREFLNGDSQEIRVASLFDRSGHPLAGNLDSPPPGLPSGGHIAEINLPAALLTPHGAPSTPWHPLVRLLVMPLDNGRTLLVGVGAEVVHRVEEIVSRALWLMLPPMLLVAIAAGYVVSLSALRRVARVHESSRRIMAGQLNERLPTRGTRDAFDRLSHIVNDMLDEIERLVLEAKGVGEDIAHDLRTPLTRLRARLESELSDSELGPATAAALADGIDDIDKILATIGALLRIADMEQGARRAAFREVDLRTIVLAAVELYGPIAEEKGVSLQTRADEPRSIIGDSDLLFEAVTNLLDNAIKFTPPEGAVVVSLRGNVGYPRVEVADDGPGIAPSDWTRVTRRFFRADRSRHTPGNGLGLSLVAAISRLHGFGLALDPAAKGCRIELECWPRTGDHDDSELNLPGLRPAAAVAGCERVALPTTVV